MKLILIILALAAYGAYSLFSPGTSKPKAPAQLASVQSQATSAAEGVMAHLGISSAADLAATAAAKVTGLEVQEIPETGCSDSALSPSQVLELLNTMPEAQRVAVAKLLDVSSSVWSAQLYTGEGGVGLCLPAKGKLVRLPSVSAPTLSVTPESLTGLIRSAGEAITGAHTP